MFEDEDGNGVPVGGPSLAYLLQDHPSLRLAVLNACNGARASRDDTFAGTAQVLVQRGVPAVIAMQSEVMDETACGFAEKFYRGARRRPAGRRLRRRGAPGPRRRAQPGVGHAGALSAGDRRPSLRPRGGGGRRD